MPAEGQFSTVLNWPDDELPTTVASNTQLNLLPGPRPLVEQIGNSDGTSTGIEVNLDGGSFGLFTPAYGDVTINLHGSTYGSIEAYDGVVANYLSGDNLLSLYPNAGAQVNVLGGSVDSIIIEGGETNVFGGEIEFLNARSARAEATIAATGGLIRTADIGSRAELAMTGGAIGRLIVSGNGIATVEGGRIGDVWRTSFSPSQTNRVALIGGRFEIDGTPVAGFTSLGDEVDFELPSAGAVLTGVLSDGSTLALEVIGNDGEVDYGPITLRAGSVPSSTGATINLPVDPEPQGLRGETLNIESGGRVGSVFAAIRNSTINLSRAGAIGDLLRVADTSAVNNAGGSIGNEAVLLPGATLTQDAGRVGNALQVRPSAIAMIYGGVLGDGVRSRTGFGAFTGDGVLKLFGDNFRIDGVAVAGLDNFSDEQTIEIPNSGRLIGELTDGTPITLSGSEGDHGEVTLVRTPVVVSTPGQISVVSDRSSDLYAARSGQTVEVAASGTVGDSFAVAIGGELLVSGGSVGENLEVTGGRLRITAGTLGEGLDVIANGHAAIEGGSIGGRSFVGEGGRLELSGGEIRFPEGFASANSLSVGEAGVFVLQSGEVAGSVGVNAGGSVRLESGQVQSVGTGGQGAGDPHPAIVQLVGGEIRSTLRLAAGAQAFISGGVVRGEVRDLSFQEGATVYHAAGVTEERLNLSTSSVVLSGGVVSDHITVWAGGVETGLALFGDSFELNGVPLTLGEGQTLEIAERSGTLSGVLSDGNSFSFRLVESRWSDGVHVHPDRLLTLTRVEQMQGDFNDDGLVDLADYLIWQDATANENLVADANYDGLVDNNDLDLWRHRFGTDYSRLGDFNDSGVVDAADYAVWRDRRDSIAHLDDLHLWRNRFGTSYDAAAVVSVPVPEPVSAAMLALASVGLLCSRRSNSQ